MTLRSHQLATAHIADEIAAGAPIRRIYASVTPGGGKSALPGILADRLMPGIADRILWVVPRNTLREQGEGDFPEWSRYRIRAAGNEYDPCRGTAGYVTTYQAIVADPDHHLRVMLSVGRWILFLDEPHHVALSGEWDHALSPLVTRARLVVYASGTFARGDGQPIAGIEYGPDGLPNFGSGPESAVIEYSRTDALREGAIVPVHFSHLDGRAEWEDTEGQRRQAGTLASGDYASAALFTALRTEYALELLDETVSHWRRYRAEAYPAGKLLVVAPSIELAGLYQAHLHRRRIEALIATSDDGPQAREAIARFKGRAASASDCLVTVAMAYEGMSVPAVSHIACLTHIRSIPWLEQCFARGNRTAPGKSEAFVFGPADERYRAAIASIEAEQVQALAEPKAVQPDGNQGNGEGGGRPKIQPIGSAAYREGPDLFDEPREARGELPDGGMTPREAERLLRQQIARHIEIVVGARRPGSKGAIERIIMLRLKEIVGGKAREDCSTEELARQWAWLKERYPL
jgi:superfamily II DNA or RNA helicase